MFSLPLERFFLFPWDVSVLNFSLGRELGQDSFPKEMETCAVSIAWGDQLEVCPLLVRIPCCFVPFEVAVRFTCAGSEEF